MNAKIYKVKSKSRDIYHIVKMYEDGRAECDCKFYKYKGVNMGLGTCSHIKKVIEKNENKFKRSK